MLRPRIWWISQVASFHPHSGREQPIPRRCMILPTVLELRSRIDCGFLLYLPLELLAPDNSFCFLVRAAWAVLRFFSLQSLEQQTSLLCDGLNCFGHILQVIPTISRIFLRRSDTCWFISWRFSVVEKERAHLAEQNLPEPYSPWCSRSHFSHCILDIYRVIRTLRRFGVKIGRTCRDWTDDLLRVKQSLLPLS